MAGVQLQEVLQRLGLEEEADLAFAFASEEEAADAGGEEIVTAWRAARSRASLPSAARLWRQSMQLRPGSASQQQPAASRPEAPRAWRGVQRARQPRSEAPAADAERRRQVAAEALRVACSWGTAGALSQELKSVPSTQREAWRQRQVERLMEFEAGSIRSAMRTWSAWRAWCSASGVSELSPRAGAVQEFMCTPMRRDVVRRDLPLAPSVPLTRWNALRWVFEHLGSPVEPAARDKPRRRARAGPVVKHQRVACEPELALQIEEAWAALPPGSVYWPIGAAMLFLWMAVLRFKHAQRSCLVRLTSVVLEGVCHRGKRKPGFRWACPRFAPGGGDVGGALWKSWHAQVKSSGGLVYGTVLDHQGAVLGLGDFHRASRAFLAALVGTRDVDLFSSYSLRRSLPSVAEVRGATSDEADALGDWEASKEKVMRIRYADCKEDSAAVAKLLQVAFITAAAGAGFELTWQRCREQAIRWPDQALRPRVLAAFAGATVEQRTDPALLQGVVQERRSISLPAKVASRARRYQQQLKLLSSCPSAVVPRAVHLQPGVDMSKQELKLRTQATAAKRPLDEQLYETSRGGSTAASHGLGGDSQSSMRRRVSSQAGPSPQSGAQRDTGDDGHPGGAPQAGGAAALLPESGPAICRQALAAAEAGALHWAAVSFSGEPVVHFLPAPKAVPFCRRRKGERGRPLVRVAAAGDGLATLAALAWPASACCPECLSKMPLDSAEAVREAMM